MYMSSKLFCLREVEITADTYLYYADSNCVIYVSLQEHYFQIPSSVSFFFL